jgi:hypothetical protein
VPWPSCLSATASENRLNTAVRTELVVSDDIFHHKRRRKISGAHPLQHGAKIAALTFCSGGRAICFGGQGKGIEIKFNTAQVKP